MSNFFTFNYVYTYNPYTGEIMCTLPTHNAAPSTTYPLSSSGLRLANSTTLAPSPLHPSPSKDHKLLDHRGEVPAPLLLDVDAKLREWEYFYSPGVGLTHSDTVYSNLNAYLNETDDEGEQSAGAASGAEEHDRCLSPPACAALQDAPWGVAADICVSDESRPGLAAAPSPSPGCWFSEDDWLASPDEGPWYVAHQDRTPLPADSADQDQDGADQDSADQGGPHEDAEADQDNAGGSSGGAGGCGGARSPLAEWAAPDADVGRDGEEGGGGAHCPLPESFSVDAEGGQGTRGECGGDRVSLLEPAALEAGDGCGEGGGDGAHFPLPELTVPVAEESRSGEGGRSGACSPLPKPAFLDAEVSCSVRRAREGARVSLHMPAILEDDERGDEGPARVVAGGCIRGTRTRATSGSGSSADTTNSPPVCAAKRSTSKSRIPLLAALKTVLRHRDALRQPPSRDAAVAEPRAGTPARAQPRSAADSWIHRWSGRRLAQKQGERMIAPTGLGAKKAAIWHGVCPVWW